MTGSSSPSASPSRHHPPSGPPPTYSIETPEKPVLTLNPNAKKPPPKPPVSPKRMKISSPTAGNNNLSPLASPAPHDNNPSNYLSPQQSSLMLSSIATETSQSADSNGNNKSPSPGKRAEKQDVAKGLTASKGSIGSHKKKKKPPHHLQPPQVPKQNFAGLLEEHGSFVGARKALRRR